MIRSRGEIINIQGDVARLGLSSNQALPSLGTLANDIRSIFLILALARKGKLVLWLAIRNLVDAKPFVSGAQQTRKVALDIFNVVELGCERVVDVNDDDLPVGLFLVEQGHHTQDLDLLHLAGLGNELANFADVERIVVTFGLCFWMDDIGVFPGLAHVRRENDIH